MQNNKKQTKRERAILCGLALVVLALLAFFFRDIVFPFLRLEISGDVEGAKELLTSKGILGCVTVSLIEALQMVVVFIPAEFIQLSSGVSYPWWLAILLCDVGVALGSSIIFFLVNSLKFGHEILKSQPKIQKYEHLSKHKSTVILMFVLFIMPIIPFGSICYYGASKKLPYHRYLFTCTVGALPSIATSILMGAAIKKFMTESLPVWSLILVIVGAAAILFALLTLVLRRFFFKYEKGEPNPPHIFFIESLILRVISRKVRYELIHEELVRELDGPFIYLLNHHSWLDIAALHRLDPARSFVGVINQHYFSVPVVRTILKKAGHIGKKMFYPDIVCVKNIIRAVRRGYPVALFPEARLSTDGGPSYINASTAALCQKLNVPVVLIQIRNHYFIKPKWRKRVFPGTCEVEVMRVVRPEEYASLGQEEFADIIRENLSYNEFTNTALKFRSAHKAQGLEHILYLCPHCGSFYSNRSEKNTLACTQCGKEYHILDNYQFAESDIPNIFAYFARIKESERRNLASVSLDIPVDVKIFESTRGKARAEKGVFHLDCRKVSFRSTVSDVAFEYSVETLEGIAYSVNEEFELYHLDELWYFYPPEGERTVCTRVSLLFELLKGEYYEQQRKNERS